MKECTEVIGAGRRAQEEALVAAPTKPTAVHEAADAACGRTALCLLDTRLQQLRATAEAATSKATEAAVPKPRGRWAERLAPLAALPTSDDHVRVVT
ncbi:hypothetical protein ACFY3M_53720 [Streptomyces mirabilis]|uniref:hypothetical protein n=1 Tax=Streptomyces mirabilis TaxID=68239 RepID=UPI00368EB260